MKRFCVLILPLAILALAGCNSKATKSETPENDKVNLFKEGKGVWFSDETVKLFGLQVAEVIEKTMPRRMEKMAQVYRGGSAVLSLTADEAKELKTGQRIRLKGTAEETTGTLVRLDIQGLTTLGQIEGLIEFPDPQKQFPAGTFFTAALTNGQARSVLVVPESAVLGAADGSYVYAVNGTHLTRTRVKTGTTDEGLVEIEDGLYAGDSVAAKGVENLWLVELSALKGGTPCCPVPKKSADK